MCVCVQISSCKGNSLAASAAAAGRALQDLKDEHVKDDSLSSTPVGCPYYASKALVGTSELIIGPYQYLFNPEVAAGAKLPVQNAIVIVDEAHNIEDVSMCVCVSV